MRFELRLLIGSRPYLYFPMARISPRLRALSVRRDTELVVEGYPRSGNSFAMRALRMSQSRELRLAHHLHAPAQVLRAVAWEIPAMVLVRQPADAVVSSLMRLDWQRPGTALREWLWFYRSIVPVAERVVIATFDEVTTDFGRVVERINAKFGLALVPFVHSREGVEAVFGEIDAYAREQGRGAHQVSRPTEQRAARKKEVARLLETPDCERMLRSAEALYEELARQ
jgi:hypothetical protein